MRNKRLACILGIGALAIAAALWVPTTNMFRVAKARYWARLAPLPSGARELKVVEGGGTISGDYTVFFAADSTEIRQWIHDSPCLASMGTESADGRDLICEIREDAEERLVARVRVDASFTKVRIQTFWN